ncbi:MAG: prepilin peptidase [Planctomycetota bacterium]
MNPSLIVVLAALALLLAAVVFDLRSRTIPDSISIAMVLLGLLATACGWIEGGCNDWGWARFGIGLAVGFGIGAALFYLGAMGGGDAKLCAGLGAICGWPRVLEVLFATALFGGLLSWWARRRGMTSLPYAPALAAGYASTVAIAWLLPPSTGLWHLITGRAL